MNSFKEDMTRIQALVSGAFTATGGLVALTDGGMMHSEKLQRTLEQTLEQFERAALELRTLTERNSPGAGGYGKRPILPAREVTGSVNKLEYSWLHITLNTLLPHCRFQTPDWLKDTLRRLLDNYEAAGGTIPMYRHGAVLVLDEHSGVEGRPSTTRTTRAGRPSATR